MKTTLHLTTVAFGLATFNLSAAMLYVSLESTNPVAPYATWATAATNIQNAVDESKAGDTVLVTNGVYSVGSRDVFLLDTNQQPAELVSIGASRVVVTNSIRLQSVNGPLVTAIMGDWLWDPLSGGRVGTNRCVHLSTNAVLSGFRLTDGYGNAKGGGVFCETSCVVTNCILSGNSASWGGGAFGGTLFNCILTGNSSGFGGGARGATLYSCTLTGNRSPTGGGADSCTLYNCLLRDNEAFLNFRAPSGNGGGASSCILYNCVLSGNWAHWGGGADFSTLYNCTLTGNSALQSFNGDDGSGGGARRSTLYNCTLTSNSADYGGGAFQGTLYNCIVYYNTAPNGANYFTGMVPDWGVQISTLLQSCCTTPLPTDGVGNITGPPLFVGMAAGDFRLWEGSPCIDAGTNLLGLVIVPIWIFTNDYWQTTLLPYSYEPTDILGNTRFIDGNGDGKAAWDIGAYEFNSFRPPRFTCPPQLMPDCWKLSITGATNKWVRVQRSGNLKDWEDVWLYDKNSYDIFMGSEGVQQVTDVDAGTEQKVMFYRAVVP